MRAYQLLKGASRCLPPGLEARLRTRVREFRTSNERRKTANWRQDMLLAPRLPDYSIGPHTTGYPEVRRNLGHRGDGNLTIGDYCSIADGVTILPGNEHGTDWLTTYPFSVLWPEGESLECHPQTKGDVTIGNDVWIGTNSLVLSGTDIGDGAVIGAGSVVRGRIPPYAIAVGSPCRTVMYRFKPDDIAALLAVRWWDWPEDVVAQALPILLSDDVGGIMDFARRHSLLTAEPEEQPLTT